MKLPSLRLATIARSFERIPRWAGEHPFLSFLMLLMVALLISALVFYQFVFLAQDIPVQTVDSRFNNQAFEEVIQTWEELEQKSLGADTLAPRDIFAEIPRAPGQEAGAE